MDNEKKQDAQELDEQELAQASGGAGGRTVHKSCPKCGEEKYDVVSSKVLVTVDGQSYWQTKTMRKCRNCGHEYPNSAYGY